MHSFAELPERITRLCKIKDDIFMRVIFLSFWVIQLSRVTVSTSVPGKLQELIAAWSSLRSESLTQMILFTCVSESCFGPRCDPDARVKIFITEREMGWAAWQAEKKISKIHSFYWTCLYLIGCLVSNPLHNVIKTSQSHPQSWRTSSKCWTRIIAL